MNAVLLLAVLAPQSKPEGNFISPARYIAGSRVHDTRAPGGFGSSDRFPVAVADRRMLFSVPKAFLKAESGGFDIWLTNGGKSTAWFHAADSNLRAVLEAKDARGQWRPIEFHYWASCGNSYHRVALGQNEGWNFKVVVPKGPLRTQVRWHLYNNETDLFSNGVDAGIPRERFELSPEMAKGQRLRFDWGVPTLVPKGMT